MSARSPFAVDATEPLAPLVREAASRPASDVRELLFEYSSRGDRVPGRLLLATADTAAGKRPLVLVQRDVRSAAHRAPDPLTLSWARRGVAVACIDLPLHGARTNPKLGERLRRALGRSLREDALGALLWIDFVRQGVVDLRRALAALEAHPQVDTRRVAYAGFGLGALVGVPFCAEEPQVCGAALALAGGGVGPAAVDPVMHVPRLAPRPLLFVNALSDEGVSRAEAEALHEAAEEPKEVLWFDCRPPELPQAALDAIWSFLHDAIGRCGAAPEPA